MNSLEQAEDLKAFERRLTEYIHCLQPATGRWRMLLIVVSVCTATGAWNWLIDPETQKVSFLTSLWNHPFFTLSCITLIGLFFAGIHKRVVAPSMYPFSASSLGTLPGEGGRSSLFQCRVSFNRSSAATAFPGRGRWTAARPPTACAILTRRLGGGDPRISAPGSAPHPGSAGPTGRSRSVLASL
uniref:Nuclear envelope phosphatase-regulatory subunit 1 n=1 Tax=Pipistrellus kuhlii TaxID=59472 RepID=A0A7J7UZY4_PIPKU|nr:CTD nuclear envelope phosphatase 1 regulatory subunit 1 [Pipistrellus kuhlii]